MSLKTFLLLAFAGCVWATHGSDSVEREEIYSSRLKEAFQSLGQCALLNSMMTENNNSFDLAQECVEGSPLQALLPALYAEVSVKPTECLESAQELLQRSELWDRMETRLAHFMSTKAGEKSFCHFLDKYIAPLTCSLQTICPGEANKQVTESYIASYYSVQQFLHRGVDTKFRCNKTDVEINPALYKFGTKFNQDMKYLVKELNCTAYEPKFVPSSTATLPTTTKSNVEKVTWTWNTESVDDDEDEFESFSNESEESNGKMSTTTAESKTVRVQLNRGSRSRV